MNSFDTILEEQPVEASAACRVDMGGTLDILTFSYPLRHLLPCTFNIALDLRTRVRLLPYRSGRVKVSSRGFKSAEFPIDQAPFRHPLGLMFATAAYFRAAGVHIQIESASPPRSALGGSSAAAVALIGAFSKLREIATGGRRPNRRQTALLGQAIEESVAGVPCGYQDQLAAVFGGVNVWYWSGDYRRTVYKRKAIGSKGSHQQLMQHILIAYCGLPHESRDINGRWVKQFLAGRHRDLWADIVHLTHQFVDAVIQSDFRLAAACMNREVALRTRMAPGVLDTIGSRLAASAAEMNCGARFTGAGGGGCVWAIGESAQIEGLRSTWQHILGTRAEARLLDVGVDRRGLEISVTGAA